MKIDVSQLLGRKGATIDFSKTEDMVETLGYPDVVIDMEPVKIEGILTNVDETIILDAKGQAQATLGCSRCLAPVKVELNFTLIEKFSHAGVLNEEAETFSGDQIDLLDIVKRSIVATLPMKVVCKEDCLGLCLKCGADLNLGDCGCDATVFDPRFESLRALFKVDEEV